MLYRFLVTLPFGGWSFDKKPEGAEKILPCACDSIWWNFAGTQIPPSATAKIAWYFSFRSQRGKINAWTLISSRHSATAFRCNFHVHGIRPTCLAQEVSCHTKKKHLYTIWKVVHTSWNIAFDILIMPLTKLLISEIPPSTLSSSIVNCTNKSSFPWEFAMNLLHCVGQDAWKKDFISDLASAGGWT